MKTTTKTTMIGSDVAFNAGLAWLYGADAMNVIFTVTDSRVLNGTYVFTVASANRVITGVFGDDIHMVGR